MQCHGDEEGVRRQLHVKAYEEPEMAIESQKAPMSVSVDGCDLLQNLGRDSRDRQGQQRGVR